MNSILKRVDPEILKDGTLDFPPPTVANDYGVVGVSADITVGTLIKAYSMGIFPWPYDELTIPWTAPWRRGVLPVEAARIPSRDNRYYKKFCGDKGSYEITINRCFEDVIRRCAQKRLENGEGTWITEAIHQAYSELHSAGFAYSVEVRDGDRLVGGLYGVCLSGLVSAESMFFEEKNAGKFALIFLLKHLVKRRIRLLDIQMVTSVTAAYGGIEISQGEFSAFVRQEIEKPLCFSGLNPESCNTRFDTRF